MRRLACTQGTEADHFLHFDLDRGCSTLSNPALGMDTRLYAFKCGATCHVSFDMTYFLQRECTLVDHHER